MQLKVVIDVRVKEGYMPLENNLKVYRAKKSMNQSDLGKQVGVSRQTISSIERGEYNPSIILALKIAKVFNTTVEDLFTYLEDDTDEY